MNVGGWFPDATQGTVTASPSCTVSVVGGLRMIVSPLLAVAGGEESKLGGEGGDFEIEYISKESDEET